MRRKFPVSGVILILIGVAGLAWLSTFQGGPWETTPWGRGALGRRGFFSGRGIMPWISPGIMGGGSVARYGKKDFDSNGERIYYTGTSTRTGPIPFSGGPMWLAHGGIGCVACHGAHGRGGVPVMMGTAIPEDIRYEALTRPEHGERGKGTKSGEEMEHPPYTDALIKRAVTEGLDPAGKPLDWTMPRWQMSEQDLNDVVAYLKMLR